MGLYYFAIDRVKKLQMWAPKNYADKYPSVFCPSHPLPSMVFMKNAQGYNFQVTNDGNTYEEHDFKDVTDDVFQELKDQFPEHYGA